MKCAPLWQRARAPKQHIAVHNQVLFVGVVRFRPGACSLYRVGAGWVAGTCYVLFFCASSMCLLVLHWHIDSTATDQAVIALLGLEL
jgi:hypothetical protein